MNVPNTLTFLRIALSPVFFLSFFADSWFNLPARATAPVILVLFLVIELSDLFDGMAARKLKQETDLGKVLDPFADSFSRLTYFLCFAFKGIMPVWIFFIVLYRDLGVAFVRLLAAGKGKVLSARLSGKIKAVVYAVAGMAGVLYVVFLRLDFEMPFKTELILAPLFYLTGGVALWSLADYVLSLRERK